MSARRWVVRAVALASIASPVAATLVDAAHGWPSGGIAVIYGPVAIAFTIVGWVIAERRPTNRIGPLLLLFGLAFSVYFLADAYVRLPGEPVGAALVALFLTMLDAPMLIVIALVLILFPDGRPPAPGWRWVLWVAWLGIALAALGFGLQAGPVYIYPEFENPIGIPGFPGLGVTYVAYALMLLLLVAAAAALIVRWRRGDLVQRTQVKWVAAAALLLLGTELLNVATFRPDAPLGIVVIMTTFALAFVPVAIGIAILRYRLYDIDRIISRSVSWAAITGVLVAVFAGAVVALQALLAGFTQGQTLAVAASTLVAFALFQPVRRRVQQAVDRRFDRARYDSERIVASFAERLRAEVDLVEVVDGMRTTVEATVRPVSAAVWLRVAPEDGR